MWLKVLVFMINYNFFFLLHWISVILTTLCYIYIYIYICVCVFFSLIVLIRKHYLQGAYSKANL